MSDFRNYENQVEQNLDELAALGYLERTVVDGEPRYKPTEAGRQRLEELGRYDPDENRRRKKAMYQRLAEAMTEDEKSVFRWMADNGVDGFVLKEEVAEATEMTEAQAEEALIGLRAFGLVDHIRNV